MQEFGRTIPEALGNPFGLLIASGDHWRASRRTLTPAFSSFKIKQVQYENNSSVFGLLIMSHKKLLTSLFRVWINIIDVLTYSQMLQV